MPTNLLNEFLVQDCDAFNRDTLLAEIGKHGASKVDILRKYTFNRFNLRMDFQKQEVVIGDELDVSEEGSRQLPLREFTEALLRHHPRV